MFFFLTDLEIIESAELITTTSSSETKPTGEETEWRVNPRSTSEKKELRVLLTRETQTQIPAAAAAARSIVLRKRVVHVDTSVQHTEPKRKRGRPKKN